MHTHTHALTHAHGGLQKQQDIRRKLIFAPHCVTLTVTCCVRGNVFFLKEVVFFFFTLLPSHFFTEYTLRRAVASARKNGIKVLI